MRCLFNIHSCIATADKIGDQADRIVVVDFGYLGDLGLF